MTFPISLGHCWRRPGIGIGCLIFDFASQVGSSLSLNRNINLTQSGYQLIPRPTHALFPIEDYRDATAADLDLIFVCYRIASAVATFVTNNAPPSTIGNSKGMFTTGSRSFKVCMLDLDLEFHLLVIKWFIIYLPNGGFFLRPALLFVRWKDGERWEFLELLCHKF